MTNYRTFRNRIAPFVAAAVSVLSGKAHGQQTEATFVEPSVVEAESPDTFDDPPADNFFTGDEDSSLSELGAETPTNWNEMLGQSFGSPDEAVAAPTSGAKPKATTERNIEILPPVHIENRLINESSLPLLAVFGGDTAAADSREWPRGKTWLTGQLPVSRTYNLKGCKFNIKTGPIGIAQYSKSGSEFVVLTDSARPMGVMQPERASSDLYLSANTDLYPEIDASTLAACNTNIKGRIFSIGRFDMSASALQLKQATFGHAVQAVDRKAAKAVQVYLYWPSARKDPLLIDDTGLYPMLSTAVFKVSSAFKGSGFIEVIPHLTYSKGGKALTRAQLMEFWGE